MTASGTLVIARHSMIWVLSDTAALDAALAANAGLAYTPISADLVRRLSVRFLFRIRESVGNFLKNQKHMILEIDISATIDRCFRYIEMLALTTLVHIVLSITNPSFSYFLLLGMSFSAGLYLGIPLSMWLKSGPDIWDKSSRILIAVLLSASIVKSTLPLQLMLSATFQIDAERANSSYKQWVDRVEVAHCARLGIPFE